MIKSAEIQRPYPLVHGGRPLDIVFAQHSAPTICLPLYCHTTPIIIKEGGCIGGYKPRIKDIVQFKRGVGKGRGQGGGEFEVLSISYNLMKVKFKKGRGGSMSRGGFEQIIEDIV